MKTKITSESGREYEIDTAELTCTCPDFKYRRCHFSKDNEERMCKHMFKFFEDHPELKPIELIKQEKLMESKSVQSDGKTRYPRVVFDSYVSIIRSALSQFKEVDTYEICGSYRRMADMVSDLDVLISLKEDTSSEGIFNYFENFLGYEKLWRGDIKAAYMADGFVHIDFKIVPKTSWAFSLLHFTGSKYENIAMRRRANSLGYKLNEYGLFNENGDAVEGLNTEEDVYEFLKLPFKKPWNR